jgi:hypothetical protein
MQVMLYSPRYHFNRYATNVHTNNIPCTIAAMQSRIQSIRQAHERRHKELRHFSVGRAAYIADTNVRRNKGDHVREDWCNAGGSVHGYFDGLRAETRFDFTEVITPEIVMQKAELSRQMSLFLMDHCVGWQQVAARPPGQCVSCSCSSAVRVLIIVSCMMPRHVIAG